MKSLIDQFNEDMIAQHRDRIARGYNARIIGDSLDDIGGYETAKKFMPRTGTANQGFLNLVDRKLLAYSIESLIIKPQYASLFTDRERGLCRELLEMYGYKDGAQQQKYTVPKVADRKPAKPADNSLPYTPQQQTLFDFIQDGTGNGIINAVAGSGKTTTILECSKFIPQDTKALFCAFNKSIANEINAKLKKRATTSVIAKTIHALGFSILNKSIGNPNMVEDKYIKILNSEYIQESLTPHYENLLQFANDRRNSKYQVNEYLIDLVNKYRLVLVKTHDDIETSEIKNLIEQYNILERPAVADYQAQEYSEMLYILLKHGNEQVKEQRIVDYTDMIYIPNILNLQSHHKYEFLFVDECQDLSRAQLLTVMKYIGENSRVVAVGDPYQAINGFAGADTDSFKRVSMSFKAKPFPLTVCFRCPEEAISMAQKYCSDIRGTNKPGKVTNIRYYQILSLAKTDDLIISRKKEPLIKLMFLFIDKDIKVHFRTEDAKDVIAKLRNMFKPGEMSIDFKKDKRTITDVLDEVIERNMYKIRKQVERSHLSHDNKQIEIALQEGYLRADMSFIEKLYHTWKTKTIKELLARLYDHITAQTESIRLSTIHCAKGLENDRVFIIDYNLLPHSWQGILKWQEEQERNLVYVALTRAKKELYLVESEESDVAKQKDLLFNISPGHK